MDTVMKGTAAIKTSEFHMKRTWVHTSCRSGLVFASPSQVKCENEEIYGWGEENVLVIPWSSTQAHPLAAFENSRTNIFTACESLNQGWVKFVCTWIATQITRCRCMRAYGCYCGFQVHTVKMWWLVINCDIYGVSEVGLVSYVW